MSDPGGFGPLVKDERERIGPFRIVGRMGAGGMGVVYAGVADDGGRVAVKVIHPGLAADPQFLARFVREVEMLSRVRGRCVVSVLDADTGAMPPWLATEFVPGPTLAAYVQEHGPLREEELVAFGVDIAEALTDIHRAGIVHRDLKPGNVILSGSGAKVLDFGIARALDESGLTGTGALIGSPGWISPEQYRGDQADAAADVFAWGALMAYAATGRPPFGTGAPDVLAYRVMSVDPDLGEVPERVRGLVRGALAKSRTARPSASDLLARIHAAPAGTIPLPPPEGHATWGPAGTVVLPPSERRVTWWPVAAALAVVVVVTAGAVFALNSAGTPQALPTADDTPAATYTEDPDPVAQTPTETPTETPEETGTPEETPEETPEKTPEEKPTTRRPAPPPCTSNSAILAKAAALNGGGLPDDATVARKRCAGSWVAAELASPSVGGIDLIARRNASGLVGGEIGSNFCSVTDRPALLADAPASITTFLCPDGFS